MDPETLDYRPRYRLSRLGFLLAGLASGLMTFDAAVHLATLLWPDWPLAGLVSAGTWHLGGGGTIVVAAVLGSYLLWGRWREPSWQARSGLLVLLALAGAVAWVLQQATALGLEGVDFPREWAYHLRIGLRWGWMALLAGLAADVVVHLGREEGHDTRASIYALVLASAVIWGLDLLHHTEWAGVWPPRRRPFWSPLTWPLWLALNGLRGLAGFFLTSLALLAARECTTLIRELDRTEAAHDLFPSPSEAAGAALLPGPRDRVEP